MTIPRPASSAADVAAAILDAADRDIAFVVKLVGESQHRLVQHFHDRIEAALAERGVTYGDHPLLRPFIESHARELAEFVCNGIGLRHQFGLQALERAGVDPLRLLRMDLWDSLRTHIEEAERHFAQSPQGLDSIVREVAAFRASQGEAGHG